MDNHQELAALLPKLTAEEKAQLLERIRALLARKTSTVQCTGDAV